MGAEHYEINAYDAAVRVAEAIGEQQVADLLRQNLAQDEAALELLASHANRLAEKAANGRSSR
jgi:ferritin-like metal-binding protein YciE